jgi:ferredoxin--NADP+ reductase
VPTFRIAIVGAGPAGYFAAQALQNMASEDKSFAIDMIERLPTPWGLVRSGVAPDHPKIKTVAKVFEKVAKAGNFRLFGNVELGTDVTTSDLIDRYDAVIIATGSSLGKPLGIPGEELFGSLSAADFVPWYNGHPDYKDLVVPLDCDTAVVIGAGNVAMDVARMLALEPSELDETDTADHALEVLRKSTIRKVIVDSAGIQAALARVGEEAEKDVRNNLAAMELITQTDNSGRGRTMEFRFFLAPLEIRGIEHVEEIVLGVNKIEDGKVVTTGETTTIKCGLVISAIGYEASSINGVPYTKGKVENVDGRVVGTNVYAVGWAKRGPSGVIGTNKSDASDVVKLLIEDLPMEPKNKGDITDLIVGHRIVTQEHWEKINAAEIAKGEPLGKPRVKAVERPELLHLGGL